MGGFAEHLHDGLPALHEHSKSAASFVRDVTVSLAAELAAAHAAFGRDVLRLVARKRTLVEKAAAAAPGGTLVGATSSLLENVESLALLYTDTGVKLKEGVARELDSAHGGYVTATRTLLLEASQAVDALQGARAASERALRVYKESVRSLDAARREVHDVSVSDLNLMTTKGLRNLFGKLARTTKARDVARDLYRDSLDRVDEMRSQHDARVADVLDGLEAVEMQRVENVRAGLASFVTTLAGMQTKAAEVLSPCKALPGMIDAEADVRAFEVAHTTGRPSPPEKPMFTVNSTMTLPPALSVYLSQFRAKDPLSRKRTMTADVGSAELKYQLVDAPKHEAPENAEEEALTRDIDAFLDALLADGAPTPPETDLDRVVAAVQTSDLGLSWLCRGLNQRRQQSFVPFLTGQPDPMAKFRLLCEAVRGGLHAATRQNNYGAVRLLLNMTVTFYTHLAGETADTILESADGLVARFYVQDELRDDAMWQDVALWENIFDNAIRCERERYKVEDGDAAASQAVSGGDGGGASGGGSGSGGGGAGAMSDDQMVYSQMAATILSMNELSVPTRAISNFVERTCSLYSLDADLLAQLRMQVASLIDVVDQSFVDAGVDGVSDAKAQRARTEVQDDYFASSTPEKASVADAAAAPSLEERVALATKIKTFGNQLFSQSHFSEAVGQYEQALSLLAPEAVGPLETKSDKERLTALNVSCLLNAAACGIQMGEYDRAIEFAKRVLRIDPSSAKAHFRLGIAYRCQGKVVMALRQMTAVKQLVPNDEQALAELERLQELFRLCKLLLALATQQAELNQKHLDRERERAKSDAEAKAGAEKKAPEADKPAEKVEEEGEGEGDDDDDDDDDRPAEVVAS